MAKNIQDGFLTKLMEKGLPVRAVTLNGYQMVGKLIDFDTFTILLDVDGKENLLYKSGLTTVREA